jgi:flagellar biosynthesis/type III secretory pathway protein FliH
MLPAADRHDPMTAPPTTDADKLARILGLAAARKAEKMRREAGVSWSEIVSADQYQTGYADGYAAGLKRGRQTRRRPVSWRELVGQIVDRYSCALTEFEHDFCRSFLDQYRAHPTDKQQAVIEKIASEFGLETP